MNKKFASFGTALSRNEAKMVVGGGRKFDEFEDGEGGGVGSCLNVGTICCSNADCGTDCTCYKPAGNDNSICVTTF